MSVPHVTTVMPTFNEGDRLGVFLEDWAADACAHAEPIVTGVIVDDGSNAQEEARQRAAVNAATARLRAGGAPHRLVYLRVERNQGKGASIRWGWSHAADDASTWWSFIDADGAVPASEFWRVATMLCSTPADIVCGSRVLMAGRSVSRSFFRHMQGRTFAACVESLFHLGFYDTQCGMKFFRASAVRKMLPRLEEDRWLLDIELLVLLTRAGASAVEVPIDCHERGGSSLVFGIDPIRMLFRLARLKRRLGAQAS
jgi:glycosyltransferase involved in cell wall biosynthesis